MSDSDTNSTSITLKIRFSGGNTSTILVRPDETTVLSLKEQLQSQSSMVPGQMRLVYAGRVLQDANLLSFYDIRDGHTIHLVRGASNKALEQASNSKRDQAGSQSKPPQTSHFMKDLLNSSFMKSMMANPEVVRALMLSNPQVKEMVERNPEIGHILNDPNFLQQTIDLARNPELMREMMRNNDRALSNLEMLPGGFNHLRKMYHNLQEPLESAHSPEDPSTDAVNERWAQMLNATRASDGQPNTMPLPNPWTRRPLPSTTGESSRQPSGSSTRAGTRNIGLASNGTENTSQKGEQESNSNTSRNSPSSLRCPPAPRLPLLNMRGEPTELEQTSGTQGGNGAFGWGSTLQRNNASYHPNGIDTQLNGSFTDQPGQTTLRSEEQQQQQHYEQMMNRLFPPNSSSLQAPSQPHPSNMLMGTNQNPLFQNIGGNLNQELRNLLSNASQSDQNPSSNFMSQMFNPNIGTPSSPTTSEPPEMRFRDQLRALNEMGFNDATANIRALLATGGDVNSAVEYLLRSGSS
ncbi:hypothetical protein K7432_004074 [Basidiobolus ranarum]|uniref:Ubiquilin n=1 Tax=Basidiobolus ranarum TaxID=34480 RepID=A0ABR2WYV1_9FUNG